MIKRGQLVRHISHKYFAIVLAIFPTKRRASIIDLHRFRIRNIDINELEPYDPNGGFGGGGAHPIPIFTDSEIDALSELININGGSLGTEEIRYRRPEHLAVYNKVLRLRDSLTQSKVRAYV